MSRFMLLPGRAALLSAFAERHIGYGSLVRRNLGVRGEYSVVLDGTPIADNVVRFDSILSGTYSLTILQQTAEGAVVALFRDVTIVEGATANVSFALREAGTVAAAPEEPEEPRPADTPAAAEPARPETFPNPIPDAAAEPEALTRPYALHLGLNAVCVYFRGRLAELDATYTGIAETSPGLGLGVQSYFPLTS